MTKKKVNKNSKAVGQALGAKIKTMIQNGGDPREIPNVIWDVLKDNGVELPEKAKQAIEEYLPKQS
jgi:uncharacterized protein YpuA (DUF1002 family)